MTKSEAWKIVGRQPLKMVRRMHKALSLHPWNNTAEETQRLVACRVILDTIDGL